MKVKQALSVGLTEREQTLQMEQRKLRLCELSDDTKPASNAVRVY